MSQRTVYPSYDARPSTRNGTGSSLDLGSRTVSRFSLLTRTRESSTSYFGKRSSAPDLVGNPTTLDDTPEEQSAHGGSRRSDSPNPKKGRPWKRAVTFSLSSSGSKKTSDYPDESYFASKETIPLEGSTDDPSGRITYRKTPHPSPLPTRHMFFWGKRKRESFLQSLLPTKLKEKSRRSEDSASQSPSSHFNSLPILQKVSSHDDDDPTPLPKAQGQTSQTSRTVSPLSSRKTSQQFSRSHSLRLARPVSPLESVRSAEDDESPESPGPSTSAPPPSPWVLVPPPIWRAMKEEGSFVFRKKKHSESQSSLGQDPPPVLEISLGQSFTVSQVDLLLSERQGSPRNSSELAEDMRLRSDANSIGKGGFFRRRKPSFQVIIPRIQEAFTRRASNWSLSSSGRGSKMRRESTPISSEGEEVLSGKEEEEEKPLGSRRMSWTGRSRHRLPRQQGQDADSLSTSIGRRSSRQSRSEGEGEDPTMSRSSLSGALSSGRHSSLHFQDSLEQIKEQSPWPSRVSSMDPLNRSSTTHSANAGEFNQVPSSKIYTHGNGSSLERVRRKGIEVPPINTRKLFLSPRSAETSPLSDIEEIPRAEADREPFPALLRVETLLVPSGPPSTGNTPVDAIPSRLRRFSFPHITSMITSRSASTPDGQVVPVTPLNAARSIFSENNGNSSLIPRRASDFILGNRVPFLKEMRIKVHASTLATS